MKQKTILLTLIPLLLIGGYFLMRPLLMSDYERVEAMIEEERQSLPRMVGEGLQLDEIGLGPYHVVYSYTLTDYQEELVQEEEIDKELFDSLGLTDAMTKGVKGSLQSPEFKAEICSDEGIRNLMSRDFVYVVHYKDKTGKAVGSLQMSEKDCLEL